MAGKYRTAVRTTALLLLPLGLVSTSVLADGSGSLNETTPTFEYTSGPFIVPNMTPFAGDPVPVVCEPGTPTCDIYTLTINFSDEYRAANLDAFVDITMAWGGTPVDVGGVVTFPDFDMYLYDAAGNNLTGTTAVTAANPELISLPLDVLPNGDYQVRVIPFMPLGEAFTLTGKLSGLAEGESQSLIPGVGALGTALLLPFAIAGLARRRR